jgi:hypothetical protein
MAEQTIGRNDPCTCGSGKKYKKCCLLTRPPERLSLDSSPEESRVLSELAQSPAAGPSRMPFGGMEECPEREIRGTAEHPVYVWGKGWTPLGELRPGDWLRTENGWIEVKRVGDTGQVEKVYNLTVSDSHTYFVGSREWGFAVWVHNAGPGYLENLAKPLAEALEKTELSEIEKVGAAAAEAARSKALLESPSQVVTGRVAELKGQIPTAQLDHITMGVAVVEDASGVRSVLVSTSEPRGYLRPGVSLKPGETMVAGTGHAETDILAYAKDNNLKVIDIGATRPVCVPCQDAINPTGAAVSTPLKPRPAN